MAYRTKTARASVEETITNSIVAALEKGDIPWLRPWSKAGLPRNFVSNRPYTGINMWILLCGARADPRYMTYKQAQSRGWQVRAGEHGVQIVFYKVIESKTETDKNGKPKKTFFLRYYTIFNVAQIDGDIPALNIEDRVNDPIADCEAVVQGMPNCPPIKWESDQASYSPMLDIVNMPPRNRFASPEQVYAVLYHELAHSTAHKSRLNRTPDLKGQEAYSFEELVAEMSASFLCSHCGIATPVIEGNTIAYIQNWIKVFKNDPKMVIKAASASQKATDFILSGVDLDEAEESEEQALVTA